MDPYWSLWGWTSLLQILSLCCFGVWVAQCCRIQGFGKIRREILAAALLISAFETVRNILNFLTVVSVSGGPSQLKELVQASSNANAVMGYGFLFSCTLAAVLFLPAARASVQSVWFLVLVTAITANLGMLVLFCNISAGYFGLP